MEGTNEESDRRTQFTISQLKEKYIAGMSQLEARMRMEADTVKMLHSKIRYDVDDHKMMMMIGVMIMMIGMMMMTMIIR